MKILPPITVVVIGLNEGNFLDETFISIKSSDYPGGPIELIYVDSGSTDESINIAHKYCNKIFIEKEWPSAARNRNRGIIESDNEIIHFIDGDIKIDRDYLKFAVEKLLLENVVCVFGYLEEEINGLGRILLHDYRNRKFGVIDAPGAGGTYFKKTLIDINGWDERFPRGEETEIGVRLRKAGYKIWYLNKKMGIHNYDIKNVFQFFKKQIKEGKSYGAITKITSPETDRSQIIKSLFNNIVFHLIVFSVIIFSFYYKTAWIIIGALLLFTFYLSVKYIIIKKIRNFDSIKFFFLANMSRTFVLIGFLQFIVGFMFLSEDGKQSFQKRINIKEVLKYK